MEKERSGSSRFANPILDQRRRLINFVVRQDFDFPEASNKVRSTRDGQYLLATGTYKPRMKVFDLEELSMKTERVTDSENVDFCVGSLVLCTTTHTNTPR